MKRSGILRTALFILSAALLLPVMASCANNKTDESSLPDESSQADIEKEEIRLDNKSYEINGVDIEATESGIYVYSPGYQPEKPEKAFTDIVIVNSIIAEIYAGETPAVTAQNGYVVRFYDCEMPGLEVGQSANGGAFELPYIPEKYVKLGDIIIPVGYENVTRHAEDTGFIYDWRWYASSTYSNIYCTEVAVSSEGIVTEINRSGDNIGDTAIPEGGFVLAVGQGSACEMKLRDLELGVKAEFVCGEMLYTVERYTYSGRNQDLGDNDIKVFTQEETAKTPLFVNTMTEIMVDKNGLITEILTASRGNTKIPEGGFAVCGTGDNSVALKNTAELGAVVATDGPRKLSVITTPKTELARIEREYAALEAEYRVITEKLAHVDYKKLDELFESSEALLAEKSDLAKINLPELQKNIVTLKNELVPSISVQDRTAWITIGERNYDNSILVHYKTQDDIRHTVEYAASLGLNTLIIDNIAAGYAVYPSEVKGMVQLPGNDGLDYIKAFKEETDKLGIRLIVMVNAFSSAVDPASYPSDHYINLYRDHWLKTNKGGTVGPDNVITLDPASKEVQEFNLAIVKEIAENYDIYGIQADYIRYPLPYYYQEHNYEDFGYNDSSVSGFIAKYGKDPKTLKISDPLWEKWCEWRRNIITDYQNRFYTSIKDINPEMNVSFTCFADYRDRQIYVYQDVELWAQNGYVDAIYPMIYGDNTEYQLKYATEILPITQYTDLILGVGTYVRATHKSMEEQYIMPYELCAEGTSNFTLRYISMCGYDATTRNAFRVAATPATASGEVLANAVIEMILNRMERLEYVATRDSDSSSEGLRLVSQRLTELKANLGDDAEAALFGELAAIKEDITAGIIVIPDSVIAGVMADIDYSLGLK